MYLPADDPREYLHLAGRVGRIGQMGSVSGTGGRVTSILRPEEAERMTGLAEELGFEFEELEYATSGIGGVEEDGAEGTEADVEELRRYLEDSITLLSEAEDIEVDLDAAEERREGLIDDDDDDDDDDEED
uniref:Helicase C-terminal domain-containing protein n=1 Tax=Trieres chinensis TaxID=1514140 RepID=A0A7S1ZKG3_TRICV